MLAMMQRTLLAMCALVAAMAAAANGAPLQIDVTYITQQEPA